MEKGNQDHIHPPQGDSDQLINIIRLNFMHLPPPRVKIIGNFHAMSKFYLPSTSVQQIHEKGLHIDN